mmetsp:Transcript_36271/g.76187  ORF Transcript_36271/g.76187 Transcript_36271/m.76187 type:complete len:373 (+) Transcript_36271:94-1212(+)
MSSTPFIPKEDEPPTCKQMCVKAAKKGCMGLGCCALIVFILAWALQGIIFWWATTASGCSAKSLADYSYPGGETSDAGGGSFNLVPKISLLAERKPMWYGQAFDIIPSNEASSVADAPTGVWWRTWGPWFYTYTYEDVANSKTTVFMRQKLLRLGQSHEIVRCDGQGPRVLFTEGANFFANRIRHLLGMNQGLSFKIYIDNELVAIAEETSAGFQSLTFRSEKGEKYASSILQDRHFHGTFDQWLDKNSEKSPIPYYVTEAATLLYAFHVLRVDAMESVKKFDKPTAFLASSGDEEAAAPAAAEAEVAVPATAAEAAATGAAEAEVAAPAAAAKAAALAAPAEAAAPVAAAEAAAPVVAEAEAAQVEKEEHV